MERNELLEQMNKARQAGHELIERTRSEKRALTAEEREQHAKIVEDVTRYRSQIQELDASREAEIAQREIEADASSLVREPVLPRERSAGSESDTQEYRERAAFVDFIRTGNPERLRAIGVSSDGGGNLVPKTIANEIRQRRGEATFLLGPNGAEVLSLSSTHTIPIEGNTAPATVVAEGDDIPTEQDTVAGAALGAFLLGKIVKVSNQLRQEADEAVLRNYLVGVAGRTFGEGIEKLAIAGAGTTEPLGLVSAVTSEQVAGAAAAIDEPDVRASFFKLSQNYRGNAAWLMHSSTLSAIMTLANASTTDQLATFVNGQAFIMGRPVRESVYMPEIATGNTVAIFGDFRTLTIADRGPLNIFQLNELFAVKNQTGYRFTQLVDSVITDQNGFAKLTMA